MPKAVILDQEAVEQLLLFSSRGRNVLEQAVNLFLLYPTSVNTRIENSVFQFSFIYL